MTAVTPSTYGIVKAIEYTVPSDTRPNVTYTVRINPLSHRPMSCTCPARKTCKHQNRIAAGQFPSKPHIRFGPGPMPRTIAGITTTVRASDLYN